MPKPKTTFKRTRNKVMDDMCTAVDQLSEFEQFRKEILPVLRKQISSGVPAQKILEKAQAIAAARMVMTMVGKNEVLARKAAQDVLDRTGGKPIERKEVKRKYEDLSDEQVDALLRTKIADLEADAVLDAAPVTHQKPPQDN